MTSRRDLFSEATWPLALGKLWRLSNLSERTLGSVTDAIRTPMITFCNIGPLIMEFTQLLTFLGFRFET
jgi:hypothetical protein